MSIGVWQLILILVLVLLFFGTGKLPKVMSDIGKGLKSLKNKDLVGGKISRWGEKYHGVKIQFIKP